MPRVHESAWADDGVEMKLNVSVDLENESFYSDDYGEETLAQAIREAAKTQFLNCVRDLVRHEFTELDLGSETRALIRRLMVEDRNEFERVVQSVYVQRLNQVLAKKL